MKILIADDDVTSRAMLAGILRKNGYDVLEAVNGTETLEIMQRSDAPRLAVIDWIMPEMDGLEVVRRIRSLKTEQPPYLIMLTAKSEKGDITTGLDAGANDYLAKPFDPGELISRIGVGQRMVEMQEELIAARNALLHEATHDALTGLLNRRAILEALSRELLRAERNHCRLSVGLFDIDHFKRVNDGYGHAIGDEVLRVFAETLTTFLRGYDLIGRYGGEEFLVVIPDHSMTDDQDIYERLKSKIAEKPIATQSGELSITVSIGVAFFHRGVDADALIEAADKALYRAKEQGRNRVCHASDAPADNTGR